MLEFYYDFLDVYVDSYYVALSGATLESVIIPHKLEEYKENKHKWFSRDCCENHQKYDNRTPGLFKLEWKGNTMCALASKCYYAESVTESKNNKHKMSCKGCDNNVQNSLILNDYLKVLQTKCPKFVTNKGLRPALNSIVTYEQNKRGLQLFNDKRIILDDGRSTHTLNL